MFQTSAFDYINVLDKAADASWLRESTLPMQQHRILSVTMWISSPCWNGS